eukprot:UC4_evm1s1320
MKSAKQEENGQYSFDDINVLESISGLILNMLAHFKINHVHQFNWITILIGNHSFANIALDVLSQLFVQISFLKRNDSEHIDNDLGPFGSLCIEFSSEMKKFLRDDHRATLRSRKLLGLENAAGLLLRCLNKYAKNSLSRTLTVFRFHGMEIVERGHRDVRFDVKIQCLKLLKKLSRCKKRPWKKDHLALNGLATLIWQNVKQSINDQWFAQAATPDDEKDAREEHEETVKAVIKFNQQYADNNIEQDVGYVEQNIFDAPWNDIQLEH